jgi:hypothetical protein
VLIVTIEVWYNKYENSWVAQVKDDQNNQIGEANYVYSKNEAIDYAKSHQEDFKCDIKVFKRDGEEQRIIKFVE